MQVWNVHASTIGKKIVKQQYLPHMSLQYGELRPTSGWDHFVSLGHPANFKGFRVLAALLHGTLLVGASQTAALNRGRHLYSAWRPSRCALAHISSFVCYGCKWLLFTNFILCGENASTRKLDSFIRFPDTARMQSFCIQPPSKASRVVCCSSSVAADSLTKCGHR